MHVVSERLGHASAIVTMTVYAHVLPGSQREAANLFARLVKEASVAREVAMRWQKRPGSQITSG